MAAAIRPARATDVDALSAIERAVFSTDRLTARSFLRLVRSASASVLAAEEGDVVLVRPQTAILNILRILGLQDLFRVASSVDEALRVRD